MSCDGCGPFLFRVVAMINAGLHIDSCIHWLKLNAAGTGLESSGQENDRAPVFPHFKKDIHTRDRRYCELFLKKDPLAQTDMDVLTKARLYITRTHTRTHARTHAYMHMHTISLTQHSLTSTLSHMHIQVILGTVSTGQLYGSQQCRRINFGCKPQIGVQIQKEKPITAPRVHTRREPACNVLQEKYLRRFV